MKQYTETQQHLTYIENSVTHCQVSFSSCRATRKNVSNVNPCVEGEAMVCWMRTVEVSRMKATTATTSPSDCHAHPPVTTHSCRVQAASVQPLAVHSIHLEYLVMYPVKDMVYMQLSYTVHLYLLSDKNLCTH